MSLRRRRLLVAAEQLKEAKGQNIGPGGRRSRLLPETWESIRSERREEPGSLRIGAERRPGRRRRLLVSRRGSGVGASEFPRSVEGERLADQVPKDESV